MKRFFGIVAIALALLLLLGLNVGVLVYIVKAVNQNAPVTPTIIVNPTPQQASSADVREKVGSQTTTTVTAPPDVDVKVVPGPQTTRVRDQNGNILSEQTVVPKGKTSVSKDDEKQTITVTTAGETEIALQLNPQTRASPRAGGLMAGVFTTQPYVEPGVVLSLWQYKRLSLDGYVTGTPNGPTLTDGFTLHRIGLGLSYNLLSQDSPVGFTVGVTPVTFDYGSKTFGGTYGVYIAGTVHF